MGEQYNIWKKKQEDEASRDFMKAVEQTSHEERFVDLEDPGYMDPDRASQIVAVQLETEQLIDQCDDLLRENYEARTRALKEKDNVTQMMLERNETYLWGYRDGLKDKQGALEDILNGTDLSFGRSLQSSSRVELFRKSAIQQMARMNDEILRRYDVKQKTGNELAN